MSCYQEQDSEAYLQDAVRPLLQDENDTPEPSLETDSIIESEELRKETLHFYFEQLTLLFYPLIITFGLVYWIETTLAIDNIGIDHPLLYYDEETTDNAGIRLGGSILNALLIVCGIALMTFLFVFCFKYRLYKFLFFWLGMSVFSILSVTSSTLWIGMMEVYRVPMDFITLFFCIWNFSIVGIVSVFWYCPLWLQQTYMIIISAATSISMLRMPPWTTWTVLITVAIYDLFAVLCEAGPLKLLIGIAEERQEDIPALVYTAGMASFDEIDNPIGGYSTRESGERNKRKTFLSWISNHKNDYETVDTDDFGFNDNRQQVEGPSSSTSNHAQLERADMTEDEEEEDEETKGMNAIKLGLGDFIFYSVLVGKASVTDPITLCLCIIAILTGLSITILILTLNRTALPALPISILFGSITYAIAYYMTSTMILNLSINIVLL